MKVTTTLIFLLTVFAYAPVSMAAEEDDLVGVWILCVDPDGDPRYWLHFSQNGSGKVVRSKEPSIDYTYEVDGLALTLVAHVGEITIPISFTISRDRQRLLLYSDATQSTSFYVREADFAKFDCTP